MEEIDSNSDHLENLRKTFFVNYSEKTNHVLSDIMWNLASIMDANIPQLEETSKKYKKLFTQIVDFLNTHEAEEINDRLSKISIKQWTDLAIEEIDKVVNNN